MDMGGLGPVEVWTVMARAVDMVEGGGKGNEAEGLD